MRALLHRLFRLIGLLATVALLPGCQPSASPKQIAPSNPVAVRLVQPKKGEATRSITLPASVFAYQQATLYAKVAGYAKTVLVDKGDAVQAGALLAEIEVPELLADRGKNAAELEVAQLDYKRSAEAQKKAPDLVVPLTVDTAKSKFEVARANLERTETLLGFAKITAPFSGIINQRMVDPGAFIPAASSGSAAQNAALFTLVDFTRVRVQVAVPEMEVPFVKNGVPVKISIEELPNLKLEAAVTRFSPALDPATKTMLCEIELANPGSDLRPGMYATVRLILERKPGALLIPVDALVVEKTRSSTFKVLDNKAARQVVKTGFNDGGWVEILEGLTGDERLIAVGKQTINEGQPVTIVEAK
jgi:membrane fusion protein (multidrug efflux system)